MTFQLAHFSDTHIGYEAYKAMSASGENQRAVDVARAFVNTVTDICESDPPLVVHSGDLADRTVIPIRLILLIRQQLQRLASIRPDGSRRQVVLIAGNHEIPRSRKEACFLHLFEGIPGVQVVTRDYETVTFPGSGPSENRPECLADVVIHALPHDALKTVDFDVVQPTPGQVNVLVAHGVAGGSELYLRSLGREFTIPTEVLARSWEYVALGHWHKQGPVPLVSLGANATGEGDRGRVWYAGSTENMGFGDLRENGTRRGWLRVTVNPAADPTVERRNLSIRSMLRLPVLDAANLTPEEIAAALIERLRATETAGVVLGQVVEGVPRDVWSLVDLPAVRAAASDALHYEVTVRPRKARSEDNVQAAETRGLGDAEMVLEERAAVVLADHERDSGLQLARELLRLELEKGFVTKEKVTTDPSEAALPAAGEPALEGSDR